MVRLLSLGSLLFAQSLLLHETSRCHAIKPLFGSHGTYKAVNENYMLNAFLVNNIVIYPCLFYYFVILKHILIEN